MATRYVRTSGGSDSNGGTSVADGWATIAHAITNTSSGDEIFLCTMAANEEFDISASIDFSTAGGSNSPLQWKGANSSGTVDGTIAVIDMQNTASVTVTISGNRQLFQNIESKNGNSTNAWTISASNLVLFGCIGDNSDSDGFNISGNDYVFIECMSHNNTGEGWSGNGRNTIFGCVSRNNGGSGFRGSSTQSFYSIAHDNTGRGWRNCHSCINCTAYNNGNNGIELTGSTQGMAVINCILEGNSSFGIDAVGDEVCAVINNAFFNNTSGETTGIAGLETGGVTLIVSPFVDAANQDFALNNSSGGGLACKAAGIPGTWVEDTITGHHDLGAVQAALRAAILTG